MPNSNSFWVMKLLVILLSIQWLSFTPTAAAPTHDSDTDSLAPRAEDNVQVVEHWAKPIELGMIILASAATLGIFGNGVTTNLLTWKYTKPDVNKRCGEATLARVTGEDGIMYKYYAYSYTTGDDCDTTQRAKTIVNALSDTMDKLHRENAYAACMTIDHGGTWHGVIGVAIDGSDKDPKDICSDVAQNAKKRSLSIYPSPLQLEGRSPEKRDNTALVKRTPVSTDVYNAKKGRTKFSVPEKSVLAILHLGYKVYMQSNVYKDCSAITGRVKAEDGITYNYFYEATGRNCDTTAQYKTIVSAIDDAWYHLDSYSAVCMKMDHGGTWRGYLGISAMQNDYPVQKMCD